jgi:V8-like Glu-specific endopeptidase
MPSSPAVLATAALALTAFVACKSREESAPAAQAPEASKKVPKYEPVAPTEMLGESLVLVTDTTRLLLAGELDRENRFPSTVVVHTSVNGQEKNCSGVLLDRWVVLTTGHCVCTQQASTQPNGQAGFLIDPSNCAKKASVKNINYTPVEGIQDDANGNTNIYFGPVQPHPRLKLLLDERGSVVSSVADLAVILLKWPVKEKFTPVPLANTEVQPLESLLIVGQAYDEIENLYDEDRRFSKNTVTRAPVLDDERILVKQPSGHTYKGDSGGPCLRENSGRTTLVGISSRNLGTGAACTSIHAYRGWLRSELQRAGGSPGK